MDKTLIAEKRIIDKAFEVGILIKAIFGFFEIFGGILLIFSSKLIIDNFIIDLAQQEITGDRDDAFANFLIHSANSIYYDAHFFAVLYLLFHGVVNIFLAISLLKNKMWAYLLSMGLFSLFIIYQLYKYFHTYSFSLLILIFFDVFIVLFIWLEYNRRK